ncbi:hypothetical protein [Nisaea nitritireducens]|uniref:hypothetical protein n=1 Tax=Nisaea nitritireducens TaxID=568392 RepID=UPI001866D336|nr:hypothetical protein [Nisaea nitritireducens]
MKFTHICAVSLLLVLGGCGLGDLFGSGTEELRVRAYVRDELDRVEADRGPRRRQYIDERISETVAAADTGDTRLSEVEETLGRLKTDLNIVARKVEKRIELGAGASAGASVGAATSQAPAQAASVDPEALSEIRADVDAALRAVSKLNADQEVADARANARFERLELHTSELNWPEKTGGSGLHLSSYRSHGAALAGWELLRTEFPGLLASEAPLFVEVDTVAGLFVRLMVGAGRNQSWLAEVRDQIRAAGEYAMIMPIPSGGASVMPKDMNVPTQPKILVPGS